ncbi:MAG: hypothetical protein ABIO50_08165 [Nitrosospira sp.]
MKNKILGFTYSLAMLAVACVMWMQGAVPLTLASAFATETGKAQCGQSGQRVCGKQDCTIKAGWAIIVYPYESCPDTCIEGLMPGGGICSVPAGSCDINCKMTKVMAKLGAPSGLQQGKTMYCFDISYDPYGGRKVSREDLGLPIADKSVTIDIGGEGRYIDEDGREWGNDQAINLNCSLNRTTYGDTKKPIPNLVFGFVQTMPFVDKFADTILINNAPIVVSEIERVIRPGGQIKIIYTSESTSKVETIISHMCLSPAVSTAGYYNNIQLDVPSDFDYARPKNCPRRDEL